MAQQSSTVRLIFDGSAAGAVAAAGAARAALRGLSKDQDDLAKSTKNVQSAVGGLIKGFAQASAFGLAAAGVGAVGTTAAAAVPALGGLAAAFATTKLGADGFKKAAEQLKKPVDNLKASLSGTFAKELTPAFAKLGPLITSLTGPLNGMAKAQAAVVRGLIDVVVNAQKLGQLNAIIQGGTGLITGMAGGLDRLVAGLLAAGAAGSSSMRGLGAAIGSVFAKIGDTLSKLAADGTIAKGIDSLSATLRGLGDVAAPLVDVLIRMGAAVGPSLGNALSKFGEAITRASPGLVELAAAGGHLLDALAPLLPTIGDVAGALASSFASTIEGLIPTIQSLVRFINAHRDQLVALIPIVSNAVSAYQGFKVLFALQGWVANATGALLGFAEKIAASGAAADVAGGKISGLGSKLSGLKGAGGAAGVALAIGAVAFAIDDLNIKAAGTADKLDGIAVNLHQFRETVGKIFSGDIGFGRMVDQAKAAAMGIQNALTGFKLTPIQLDVDTTGALTEANRMIAEINGASPVVNINGNTTGAGFAYREILREISEGKAEIIIDGQPVPAQEALARVKSLIDTAVGTVTVDGKTEAASTALARLLNITNSSVGTITIDGNKDPATGKVQQAVTFADGSKGTITVDGNPIPANGKTTGAVRFADGSRGTITIDGNQTPANGKINATVTYANGRTGTIQINANTGGAQGVIDSFIRRNDGRQIRIYTSVLGSGGIASAPRLATGGPVYGPGSGTSDTAGLFALSRGEHVLTAREVKAAGGHEAIYRMRRALTGRHVPRMAATGGRAASGGSVSSSGALALPTPQVAVSVHIGDREITDIVRTEITTANRAVRRTVGMGAGTTF